MATMLSSVVIFIALTTCLSSLSAADPDSLQDICVADLSSGVKVNGFPCKPNVTADDFFFSGLAKAGATNASAVKSAVTAATVEKIPGVNTLGVSLARIDYAPGGVNPPHTHPRATEIIFVLQGKLDVGFVTTADVLISKSISQGDIFVFPKGLIHFQKNSGDTASAVLAAFNSQLPGTQSIAASLFSAAPPIPDDVLAKAFRIETEKVKMVKSKFKK